MTDARFIRRVALRNYKSVAGCDVSLAPLTFLVGPNAAGKSNFLDALRFVADSLRSLLLRRVAAELDPSLYLDIPPPVRVPRSRLLKKPDELQRAIELAARKAGAAGCVFVLVDADDDCPAELGPRLQRQALGVRGDVPIAVVLAKHEHEAWFVAAASSLRGHRGLEEELEPPPDPEAIRGAKEWLSDRMKAGRTYSPTIDQAGLTGSMDLSEARRTDSFDKCYREIVRLIAAAQARDGEAT